MTFRFDEKPNSRSNMYKDRTLTLEYFASGTTDEAFVQAQAWLSTPAVYNGLYRQDLIVTAVASDQWDITVPYGKRPWGSVELSFDTTGGTVHIMASKATVGAYGGAAATTDFDGMIGVNQDSVDGVDIVIPTLKITATFTHDVGIITLPRIKQLARATGKVNSDTFLTFAPGEVLFAGCTGTEGVVSPTTIGYQFLCSENASSLTIGGIASIVKKGHDYVWIRFKDAVVGGLPVKKPRSAYVERVYDTTAFVPLFGFGG